MSATEELRRLLDERGVKWNERVWGGKHSVTTFWHARGVRWHYRENRFGELRLHADDLTPKQAVEATLGRGTCEVESMHGYTDAHAHTSWCVELSCHTIDAWEDSIPPSFCPFCGAKVVGR